MERLYRYQDIQYAPPVDEFDHVCGEGRLEVKLYSFPILSRTEKGAWINAAGEKRFVKLTARKRFALPTIEEARESFLARKRRQATILSRKLVRVNAALAFPLSGDPIDMGLLFGVGSGN